MCRYSSQEQKKSKQSAPVVNEIKAFKPSTLNPGQKTKTS